MLHRMSGTYAFDLLTVADHLAYRDGGRGCPQPARLRRSISTAYYALFHHLAYLAVAEMGSGDALDSNRQVSVRRWIGHNEVKKLCEEVRKPTTAVGKLFVGTADPRLMDIASAFVQLQGQRELADYAVVIEVTKATALFAVDQARQAVETSNE